jgi:hypothetical protein
VQLEIAGLSFMVDGPGEATPSMKLMVAGMGERAGGLCFAVATMSLGGAFPSQIDLTSPPSIRSTEPVIHRAPGETRNAISSAISSGSP